MVPCLLGAQVREKWEGTDTHNLHTRQTKASVMVGGQSSVGARRRKLGGWRRDGGKGMEVMGLRR